MADVTVTGITVENYETAETYGVPFATSQTLGLLVRPSGALISGVGDVVGGIIVRLGDAVNGTETLVLRRGIVRFPSANGVAIDTIIYSDGDGTASDAEPAGAAGQLVSEIGVAITTTRLLIDCGLPTELGA